jgi:hypothetical protein
LEYAVLFLVIWPWYFYLSLILGDRLKLHFQRLYVRVLSICNPYEMGILTAEREEVKRLVTELVDKYATEFFPNMEKGKIFRSKTKANIEEMMTDAFSILKEVGI